MSRKLEIESWVKTQDVFDTLKKVSTSSDYTPGERYIFRKEAEKFLQDCCSQIIDKFIPEDIPAAEKDLSVPITVTRDGESVVYSTEVTKKYKINPDILKNAGYKNQTEFFDAVKGASESSIFEGLLRETRAVRFDPKVGKDLVARGAPGSEYVLEEQESSITVKDTNSKRR